MKEWLLKQIKAKEEARASLKAKGKGSTSVEEIRSIGDQIDALDTEIAEFRTQLNAIPAETPPAPGQESEFRSEKLNGTGIPPAGEHRGAVPQGGLNPIGTYAVIEDQGEKRTKELREAAEKRGKDLLEKRAVTVGSSNIVVPQYQATDIRPTFNEVSGLIDRVTIKPLMGGESFKQPYISGYGEGSEKTEGQDYGDAEATFGYAEINKSKVTAYAEDTEELLKLPAADYDGEVMKGITIACRKRLTRQILIGPGTTNRLVGIFSSLATAIDSDTDIAFAEIDEMTLDEIIFSYGGDEEVEDAAVLILNKKDLKAFAQLRTADGKKIHDVKSKGNSGTIDGIPFIINSACKAIEAAATTAGEYAMAYGPLSNYMMCIFSDLEVQRSTDFKFKQGMIAHRGSIFAGGNVVSKNGFLRVKKQ